MRTVTGALLVPPVGSPPLPPAPQAASTATDPPPAIAAAPHNARRVVLCIHFVRRIWVCLLGRSRRSGGSGHTLMAFPPAMKRQFATGRARGDEQPVRRAGPSYIP